MLTKRFIPTILLGLVVLFAAGCEEGTLTFEGFVWEDRDGSGIKEGNEPALAGVTVHLVNPETGEIIDKTTTDENGRYSLSPIQLAQKMRIDIEIPNEMAVTIKPDGAGQQPDEIANQVDANGFSRVIDPDDVERPAGQETTLLVHAGFTRPLGVVEAAPPATPTSTPEPPPTETPVPAPSATPEPSPTATPTPTPTAEPTEVSQIIEPSIVPLDEPFEEIKITLFNGNVRNCQSGILSERSSFANIFSFTYLLAFGTDPSPDIQLSDRFEGQITFKPVFPTGSEICAGVGFYNPTIGVLPSNPQWAFDPVGTGSFFTCSFQDGTQQSGYSVFNGSGTDQYSLTEDSTAAIDRSEMQEIEFGGFNLAIHAETLNLFDQPSVDKKSFSTYEFDIPRWLLADAVSIGPTGTDGRSCTEMGLNEDLSGTYRLPLYLRMKMSHDPNTACFSLNDCGPFKQYESGIIYREADISVNYSEDAFTLSNEISENYVNQFPYLIPIGNLDKDSNTLTLSNCSEDEACNVFQTGILTISGE